MPATRFVHRSRNIDSLTVRGTPPSQPTLRQVRDLIISPVWGCLGEQQRHRWLDQFQDLAR
ncbi:hypothetical protein C2E25_02960 [Geothermobacter hydrogeniphilus]|uniref:Uncharacterized protein n=1 Tax=Geothermobacter hydrogeniphilus TaxID=1969733 RepID=A0A2K2HD92_9BACT|nr:hypothetical protein [Geothermobacter hydrogeniphilus]PNU21267.1 hypothetical protein C2E25_02960 [Geothermobacter hydrogeniphilus]